MAKAKKPKVALALQGGGAHGAFTWGVLDRLLEEDAFEVVGISGTSAGSVNAIVYAHYYELGGTEAAREGLETLWRRISEIGSVFSPVPSTPYNEWLDWMKGQGVGLPKELEAPIFFNMFDSFTRTFSPYQFNPLNVNLLRDLLEEMVDFEQIGSCTCPKVFVSATHVEGGKVKVFSGKELSVDAVDASTALPFVFQAAEVDGQHYWDGGYMGNPSLFPLYYETDAEDIIVVHINPIERPDELPMQAGEILNRVNEITFNSSLIGEMRAIAFVQKLLDEDMLKAKAREHFTRVYMHSIRDDAFMKSLDVVSKYQCDWPFISALKEQGRKAAEHWLNHCAKHVGKRDSVDLQSEFLVKKTSDR